MAETVTFGGAGLDRAADLRADPARLAEALASGRVLPFWRGRPLVRDLADGSATLEWLAPGHSLLAGQPDPVLLGRGLDGGACFGCDVSATLQPAGELPGPIDQGRVMHPLLPGGGAGFADLRAVMTGLSAAEAEMAATGKALLEWHRSHGFCAACGAASRMVQGGWQRQCPACNTPHFPRTDPVVIMLVTQGNAVLLGRSPGWPEGMYSLLAGFVEPGETMEAAVRREVAEETGVPVGRVSYLASQPWPFPANLMLGCRAEALRRDIRLDPAELEDALWLDRDEAVSVLAGTHATIRPTRRGSIAQFILSAWLADRLD